MPKLDIMGLIIHATFGVKIVMIILIGMSFFSWWIIIYKIFQLSNVRKKCLNGLEAFAEAEDLRSGVLSLRRNLSSPLFAIGDMGLQEIERIERADLHPQLKLRFAEDNVRRILRRAINVQMEKLSNNLPFLATCANAAPFIGLFGTVWGIMHSFHNIGLEKSASLATVAPGISEALVATAIGLVVAIPGTVGFNYFQGKLGSIQSELINFAGTFLNKAQIEHAWLATNQKAERK